MGNCFSLNCPQSLSRHLSDETGVGEANEKGYKDYQDGVGVDERLQGGLPPVGRGGDGEEGEEVGDQGQQEAQQHYWVSSSPVQVGHVDKSVSTSLAVVAPRRPKRTPAATCVKWENQELHSHFMVVFYQNEESSHTSPPEMEMRDMVASPFLRGRPFENQNNKN